MDDNIYKNDSYLLNNPFWHEEDSPWKAKQIKKILDRNNLNLKSVAEVGCGAGEILNQLLEFMPTHILFTGYDISSHAIKMAKTREKPRLKFKKENFLETDERFDLLLIIDVLEHVEDYLGFLRSCKNLANNFIFHIPLDLSVNTVLRGTPILGLRNKVGHIQYFNKDIALATLLDCGYEIIDWFYTGSTVDALTVSINSKILRFPRRILYRLSKDFCVRVLGGYSLMVLAK